MRKKPTLLLLGLILGLAVQAGAAELRATASMEPEEVSLGEPAQLTVAVHGSASATQPQIPQVDGLEIAYIGRTTNFQFINGVMSGGVNYIYQLVPRKTGVFTVPEISVRT